VAVLRPHVATARHVTNAAYPRVGCGRITRMYPFLLAQKDYLFAVWWGHNERRTSENFPFHALR
jgi:hypothetical protein